MYVLCWRRFRGVHFRDWYHWVAIIVCEYIVGSSLADFLFLILMTSTWVLQPFSRLLRVLNLGSLITLVWDISFFLEDLWPCRGLCGGCFQTIYASSPNSYDSLGYLERVWMFCSQVGASTWSLCAWYTSTSYWEWCRYFFFILISCDLDD